MLQQLFLSIFFRITESPPSKSRDERNGTDSLRGPPTFPSPGYGETTAVVIVTTGLFRTELLVPLAFWSRGHRRVSLRRRPVARLIPDAIFFRPRFFSAVPSGRDARLHAIQTASGRRHDRLWRGTCSTSHPVSDQRGTAHVLNPRCNQLF